MFSPLCWINTFFLIVILLKFDGLVLLFGMKGLIAYTCKNKAIVDNEINLLMVFIRFFPNLQCPCTIVLIDESSQKMKWTIWVGPNSI